MIFIKRDKHLDCSPCKILGTILKMYEGITSTNESEGTKTYDDVQGFTHERKH